MSILQSQMVRPLPRRLLRVLRTSAHGNQPVLAIYRYISWFMTSCFYMILGPHAALPFKAGVIGALFLSGLIASRSYVVNQGSKPGISSLVMVETLGIALLIVPTGGLDSPFIWYSLNPIFAAAQHLRGISCWLVLALFFSAASLGSLITAPATFLFLAWREHLWFFLAFPLLTTAAQLYSRLLDQLGVSNTRLVETNHRREEIIRCTTSLYQAFFTGRDEPNELASLLATYAGQLAGHVPGACYLQQRDGTPIIAINDQGGVVDHDLWSDALRGALDEISQNRAAGSGKANSGFVLANDGVIACLPIESEDTVFGILGIPRLGEREDVSALEPLRFLAEMAAIMFERLRIEDLASRLLVSEEQNRIANEIHDGVSQQLFSIVYALHALMQQTSVSELREQLSLIQKTARQAAGELRASIYRISPGRRGERVFVARISSYLNDLAQLNGIQVHFQPEGSEETLSPALCKALYRIVREATSNAIRHGRCTRLHVILTMFPGRVVLRVVDDGVGFDEGHCQPGLGLSNMRSLMTSFAGGLSVISSPGNGCEVICCIPDQ